MKRPGCLLLVLALAGGGLAWWYAGRGEQRPVVYTTAEVTRGDLVVSSSATGTLEPEEVVDVGAQVVGQIKNFGPDPHKPGKDVNYGTAVEEGTILAQIDDTLFKSQVAQAAAALKRAEAELEQMRVRYQLALRDWDRARKLGPSAAISRGDYDSFEAAYETARATLGTGEAGVSQAREALNQANINLGYTTIRSPVKGVIVDRRVNVGQTLIANLNAPSLFLIAKDLKRMQVWASVNEADIGRIRHGLPVAFRVDTYPGEVFNGTVDQVRLSASMVNNVVTYIVVISANNPDGRLLPYLTASVRFLLARRDKALFVPNTALRWSPSTAAQVVPDARAAFRVQAAAQANDRPEAHPENTGGGAGMVWVVDGPHVRPVAVQTGLSDGTVTEISHGDLPEGARVVVGASQESENEDATNPFLPNLFGKK